MQNVIISARFEGLVGKCMLGAMEAQGSPGKSFFSFR